LKDGEGSLQDVTVRFDRLAVHRRLARPRKRRNVLLADFLQLPREDVAQHIEPCADAVGVERERSVSQRSEST